MSSEAEAAKRAVSILRASTSAVLAFDGRVAPIRYVVDQTGTHEPALIVAMEPPALRASEHVLFVPDERAEALQVLGRVVPIASQGDAGTDRWQAFHGSCGKLVFGRFSALGAKLGGEVIDHTDLVVSNPFGRVQGKLCRDANADPGALLALLGRRGAGDVAEPVVVGVDPEGIHVRARTGVVRVPFEALCPTTEHASGAMRGLLSDRAAGEATRESEGEKRRKESA
ncbi:MAG: hypothetical protein H7Y88_04365 [Phycisphaerales bacterium]|nr:hypothetical protein [Phycisphaerales bacterium]